MASPSGHHWPHRPFVTLVVGFLVTTDGPCNTQVSHNYRCLAGNRQPNNSAISLGFPHYSWRTVSWYLFISCICFWWDPTQQSLRKQQFYGFESLNNNKHALVKKAVPKKLHAAITKPQRSKQSDAEVILAQWNTVGDQQALSGWLTDFCPTLPKRHCNIVWALAQGLSQDDICGLLIDIVIS